VRVRDHDGVCLRQPTSQRASPPGIMCLGKKLYALLLLSAFITLCAPCSLLSLCVFTSLIFRTQTRGTPSCALE